MKAATTLFGVAIAGLVTTGCRSTLHSHVNRPFDEAQVAPDCRGSVDLQRPRGEEDVLMILCLSGGGSRAAWFSAATMLRLETVVDEINLLHEVDVISSVSGGCLPAAYYCVTRDPGPYSVVRVEQVPDTLPAGLAQSVRMDRRRGLLGVRGPLSPEQRDELLAVSAGNHDRAAVERLFWLSHHTHAPDVWEPGRVKELMTRNYIKYLMRDSFSPLNLWEDIVYWTTAYDRSDQMARIFTQNLFGAKRVHVPKHIQSATDLALPGFLNRPAEVAQRDAAEASNDMLRWPRASRKQDSDRLEWIPGHTAAEYVREDAVLPGVREATTLLLPSVPYRFQDLNPERPYLVLNATSATEDDPDGLRFGDVFTFTREDFQQHLNSSIDNYDLAHAVMASAAFPAVFSFVTLRDFRPCDPKLGLRYLHVFDGGNADNLGLESAKRIILANRDRYRHFIVLVVDSHVAAGGASRAKADVRTRSIDTNFMKTFATLLETVRQRGVDEFRNGVLDGVNLRDRLTFWQLTFDDVRDPELRAKANRISTDFKIKRAAVEVIDRCVADLIRPDAPGLQQILQVLHVSPTQSRPLDRSTPDAAPDAGGQTSFAGDE